MLQPGQFTCENVSALRRRTFVILLNVMLQSSPKILAIL